LRLPKPLPSITYKDLVDNFPLKGEYIFRAKFKQGKESLWYDIDKFSPKIPTDEGSIFLKVKRISWSEGGVHSTHQHGAGAHNHTQNKVQDFEKQPKKKSFDFEEINPHPQNSSASPHRPGLAAGQTASPSQPDAKLTPNNKKNAGGVDLMGLEIDLMGTGTPSIKKEDSKKSPLNMMEDFLL
jgi:hypothetical protein